MSDAQSDIAAAPIVRCKPKHRALNRAAEGQLRNRAEVRSRCPGWVSEELQRVLLSESIIDASFGTDSFGRPRRRWNAVAKWVFVAVSSNEAVPAYNCYPAEPLTEHVEELRRRAERTVEQILAPKADGAL